jgi:hypothetical protein
MTAIAVFGPSGSSGELQFANSDGGFDAAQAFWDADKGKLFISGNLEVLGTETVIDTQHLHVEDAIIGLGTGSAGQGAAGDRGLIFLISGETNPSFYWDESENEFRAARVTNVPGDSSFENPTNVSNGGYQNIRAGIINTVSGAVFDTSQRSLSDIGSDVFIYTSGSSSKRSVFGGDVVISGTLYGGSPLKLGGEVEFITSDGGTTDLKNPSGSVKVFARDEVKIGSDDGLIRLIDLGGSSAGKIFLTGSSTNTNRRLKFLSKGQIQFHGLNPNATSPGSDVFLFVSGVIGSKRSLSRGLSLFSGDVLASGSLIAESGISGSLTRLDSGISYLTHGTDITISSGSTGQITITSNAQDQRNKIVYEVTGTHPAQSGLIIPSLDFSNVNDNPDRIDVFVNGQLMTSGTSKDYTIPQSTSILFYFNLISDDIITVRTY